MDISYDSKYEHTLYNITNHSHILGQPTWKKYICTIYIKMYKIYFRQNLYMLHIVYFISIGEIWSYMDINDRILHRK